LELGARTQSHTPHPQSPIPNPQSPIPYKNEIIKVKKINKFLNINEI